MELFLLWCVVCGGIGAAIGSWKSRLLGGFVLGLLIGPLGWLLVAVGPSMGRKCPECKGDVPMGATKCKHCGSELPLA